ncbi:hypothetical protein V8E54_001380 [Elaphomyces granulatus]
MSDPVSAIGLAASVLQLVCFTGSAIEKVARFAREARHVQETKGDLFATIINFNKSLQAVKLVLETWKKQSSGGMDTLEVGQILATANSVWKSCEEAVQRFEEKLESFGNRSRQNWLRDAMQQLKLRSRSAEMTRIKTRIDTEISTLQLLLACLKLFTLGNIHGKIEKQLSTLTVEIRRTSGYRKELRRHSQHSESNLSFSEFQNDTRLEISSQRTRDQGRESSELKAMDECLNTAYSLVEKLSKNGSVEGQTMLGENAMMPNSSRGLQDGIFDAPSDTETDGGVRLQYSRKQSAENAISSSGYFLGRHWNTSEQSTGLPVEHVTMLIDEYLCSAAEDFDAGSYYECKVKLNLAMNRGEARESQYGIPFDKRFQIKTKIAAVHAREEKFGLAMNELTELRMQAESSNTRLEATDEELGELYYAIADLHFRRYKFQVDDANLLKDLGESAEHAYGWAVRLPRFPSGSLLSRCVSILREAYILKGDDVAAKSLRQKHPIASPTLTDRPLEYRQPVASTSPDLTTPNSRTPSLVSIPRTVFSTPRQHSGSISSSQTLPSTYDANSTLIAQVEDGNLKATELLLAIGCDTEQTDSQGRTPLLIAAKNKNMDIFFLLLDRADVHVRDDNGLTVLHHALRGFGGEKIVRHLLEKDVDVNAMVANDRKTPLHYCVEYDNTPAAEILLNTRGVNIEAQNSKKETAAIIAARRKNIEMIKLLHDHGATFDRQRVPRELYSVLDMFAKRKSEDRLNTSRRGSQYAGSKSRHFSI